jgi:hypothetical protein
MLGVKSSLLSDGRDDMPGLTRRRGRFNDMKMVETALESIQAVRPDVRVGWRQTSCLDNGHDFDEVRELGGRVRIHRAQPLRDSEAPKRPGEPLTHRL